MSSSPHKVLTSTQNFSSATKDTKSIRMALCQELCGRVVYNDTRVLQRLRTHEIDDDFISGSLSPFHADPEVQSSVRRLQELEKIAEATEDRDSADQRRKQEVAMYPHLVIVSITSYVHLFSSYLSKSSLILSSHLEDPNTSPSPLLAGSFMSIPCTAPATLPPCTMISLPFCTG